MCGQGDFVIQASVGQEGQLASHPGFNYGETIPLFNAYYSTNLDCDIEIKGLMAFDLIVITFIYFQVSFTDLVPHYLHFCTYLHCMSNSMILNWSDHCLFSGWTNGQWSLFGLPTIARHSRCPTTILWKDAGTTSFPERQLQVCWVEVSHRCMGLASFLSRFPDPLRKWVFYRVCHYKPYFQLVAKISWNNTFDLSTYILISGFHVFLLLGRDNSQPSVHFLFWSCSYSPSGSGERHINGTSCGGWQNIAHSVWPWADYRWSVRHSRNHLEFINQTLAWDQLQLPWVSQQIQKTLSKTIE